MAPKYSKEYGSFYYREGATILHMSDSVAIAFFRNADGLVIVKHGPADAVTRWFDKEMKEGSGLLLFGKPLLVSRACEQPTFELVAGFAPLPLHQVRLAGPVPFGTRYLRRLPEVQRVQGAEAGV